MQISQMKVQLILKGHNAQELSKKSDEMISLMYQKEVLKLSPQMTKTIIGIKKLCAETEQLRSSLFSSGSYDQIMAMSEEELQRFVIEKQGIDVIVEGAKIMKENGLDEGLIHKYENTLQAMRQDRGKQIYEHIQTLSGDEKEAYLKSCSTLAIEDAKIYRDMKRNQEKAAEIAALSMQ